jgi:hypothetical protein
MALNSDQIGGIGEAVEGLAGFAGSLFGGRARRRAQKEAGRKLQQRIGEYEQFNFVNEYANIDNPLEDLRVNTQQAEFVSQQQQQSLANTLDALRGGGGGMGASALAQAMANQQSQNLIQASASIGAQESANQMAYAQAQQQLNLQEAAGAMDVQQSEFGRTSTLLDISSQNKLRADQARQQATQALVGGLGKMAGGAAQFFAGGLD